MKQQRAPAMAERQIAQLIQDDEVAVEQLICNPPVFPPYFSRSNRLTRSTVEKNRIR